MLLMVGVALFVLGFSGCVASLFYVFDIWLPNGL